MPKEPHTVQGGYYASGGTDFYVSKFEPGIFVVEDPASGEFVDAVEYVHSHPNDRTHIFVVAQSKFEGAFERIPDPEPDEPPAPEEKA